MGEGALVTGESIVLGGVSRNFISRKLIRVGYCWVFSFMKELHWWCMYSF